MSYSRMIRDDDPKFRITPFQQMASACTGALITSLFMTPLDVVKVRLQAQQKALLSNKCYLYCNGLMEHLCPCIHSGAWIDQRVHFKGTMDAFMKISRLEGVGALWSGLSPTLVLALPTTVIYFVSYEQLRYHLKQRYNALTNTKNQPLWIPMLCGATARIFASSIVSPLELIRTKMQSRKLSYAETLTALRQIVAVEGVRGLFKGLGSTLLRDVPFSGIYWSTYETVKTVTGHTNPETNTFAFNFCAGAIGGSIAALLTLPFDVVKTHQQIELGEKEIYADSKSAGRQRASTAQEIARHIYRSNGLRGLFAGLPPRLLKVTPACAIMIASFEYSKQFFQKYNSQQYREMLQRQEKPMSQQKEEPTKIDLYAMGPDMFSEAIECKWQTQIANMKCHH